MEVQAETPRHLTWQEGPLDSQGEEEPAGWHRWAA